MLPVDSIYYIKFQWRKGGEKVEFSWLVSCDSAFEGIYRSAAEVKFTVTQAESVVSESESLTSWIYES